MLYSLSAENQPASVSSASSAPTSLGSARLASGLIVTRSPTGSRSPPPQRHPGKQQILIPPRKHQHKPQQQQKQNRICINIMSTAAPIIIRVTTSDVLVLRISNLRSVWFTKHQETEGGCDLIFQNYSGCLIALPYTPPAVPPVCPAKLCLYMNFHIP